MIFHPSVFWLLEKHIFIYTYKLCTIESKQKELPIDWRIKDDHPPFRSSFLDSNPFRSLRDNVVMLGMHGAAFVQRVVQCNVQVSKWMRPCVF